MIWEHSSNAKSKRRMLFALFSQLLLAAGLALREPALIAVPFLPFIAYSLFYLLVNPLFLLWISQLSNMTNIPIAGLSLNTFFFLALGISFILSKTLQKSDEFYVDLFDLLFVLLGFLLLITLPRWNSIGFGFLGLAYMFLIPYTEVLILREYVNEKTLDLSLNFFTFMSLLFNAEVAVAILKTLMIGGFNLRNLHSLGIGWAYSNYIAALANLLIPLNLGIFIVSRKKSIKRISLLNIVMLLISVVFTISRGGFITFLLGFLTFGSALAISEGKIRYITGVFIAIAGLFALIFKTLVGKLLLLRFALMAAMDASISNRYRMWAQAIDYIKRNPLIGRGPYQTKVFSGIDYTENPHNYYLKLGMDAGIIGIIIFLFILAFLLHRSISLIKSPDRKLKILGISFLTTLVIASFNATIEPTLSGFHYNPIFWFIMGLMLALTKKKNT